MGFLTRLGNALARSGSFLVENFVFDQKLVEVLNQTRPETDRLADGQSNLTDVTDISWAASKKVYGIISKN